MLKFLTVILLSVPALASCPGDLIIFDAMKQVYGRPFEVEKTVPLGKHLCLVQIRFGVKRSFLVLDSEGRYALPSSLVVDLEKGNRIVPREALRKDQLELLLKEPLKKFGRGDPTVIAVYPYGCGDRCRKAVEKLVSYGHTVAVYEYPLEDGEEIEIAKELCEDGRFCVKGARKARRALSNLLKVKGLIDGRFVLINGKGYIFRGDVENAEAVIRDLAVFGIFNSP